MDFSEVDTKKVAEAEYKKLEKEKIDIAKDIKKRKTDIDNEMKERKAQIRSELAGLEKYLIAVGLRKKKVRAKKK